MVLRKLFMKRCFIAFCDYCTTENSSVIWEKKPIYVSFDQSTSVVVFLIRFVYCHKRGFHELDLIEISIIFEPVLEGFIETCVSLT